MSFVFLVDKIDLDGKLVSEGILLCFVYFCVLGCHSVYIPITSFQEYLSMFSYSYLCLELGFEVCAVDERQSDDWVCVAILSFQQFYKYLSRVQDTYLYSGGDSRS